MNSEKATRAAVEAANQTAVGFFQGIGFAAGVAALGLLGALIFHPFLLVIGTLAGGVAIYKWSGLRRRARQQSAIQVRKVESD